MWYCTAPGGGPSRAPGMRRRWWRGQSWRPTPAPSRPAGPMGGPAAAAAAAPGRAAASSAARRQADSPSAPASRSTVSRRGARLTPRSRSLRARALTPARWARASCVSPAASRWRLSSSPKAAGSAVTPSPCPPTCRPPRAAPHHPPAALHTRAAASQRSTRRRPRPTSVSRLRDPLSSRRECESTCGCSCGLGSGRPDRAGRRPCRV
jgi:hypothetical protein